MEKVLCNVYYNLHSSVTHKVNGTKQEISLGLFDSKEKADAARKLFEKAIKLTGDKLQIKYNYVCSVKREFIPENEPANCYESLEEFMMLNGAVTYYLIEYEPKTYHKVQAIVREMTAKRFDKQIKEMHNKPDSESSCE